MEKSTKRFAVVGGQRTGCLSLDAGLELLCFGSPEDVGSGELRRLAHTIDRGAVKAVIVLTRWNGHSSTVRVRRLCRNAGVPVSYWPRGFASLVDSLRTRAA